MGEWRETILGEMVELKRGYDLPAKSRELGDVPIVSSSGVSGFHLNAKTKGPGVVTGRYGTIGEVFYIPKDFWPLNTTLYVRNFKGNDPRFISYFLRGLDFNAYSDKAAVPGVNRNHLHQAAVRYPVDLREQRSIVDILGALDDKIDLNRRMNETLEQTARALFKDWFVDFGPTRAKTAGQKPYLLEEFWALFPERLDGAGMPEGWELSAVGNEINTLLGGTPSRNKAEYWGGTIPWINSGKANDFRVMSPSEYITGAGLRNSATKLLPPRTTIVAITGATLGQVSLTEIEACANQSVVGLLGSPSFPSEFIYFWVGENVSNLLASQTGGAQQHINKNDVNRLPLLKVERPLMDTYVDCVRPMFDGIKANEVEARILAQTRDLLLPKLMSGEMRVTEAAARVAEII